MTSSCCHNKTYWTPQSGKSSYKSEKCGGHRFRISTIYNYTEKCSYHVTYPLLTMIARVLVKCLWRKWVWSLYTTAYSHKRLLFFYPPRLYSFLLCRTHGDHMCGWSNSWIINLDRNPWDSFFFKNCKAFYMFIYCLGDGCIPLTQGQKCGKRRSK